MSIDEKPIPFDPANKVLEKMANRDTLLMMAKNFRDPSLKLDGASLVSPHLGDIRDEMNHKLSKNTINPLEAIRKILLLDRQCTYNLLKAKIARIAIHTTKTSCDEADLATARIAAAAIASYLFSLNPKVNDAAPRTMEYSDVTVASFKTLAHALGALSRKKASNDGDRQRREVCELADGLCASIIENPNNHTGIALLVHIMPFVSQRSEIKTQTDAAAKKIGITLTPT